MVAITYVYIDVIFAFYGYILFVYILLSWMFEHDYLDTCCFACLICKYFVFALVQRNWACFTQKGVLEICSLLLLLSLLLLHVYFFFFFCVPQLDLWGSPFWVRFWRS